MYIYRLYVVVDTSPDTKLDVVHSERLFLRTYKVELPFPSDPSDIDTPACPDTISCKILKLFHPILLSDHLPLAVYGDGNCMFRAISLGLFGSEKHHTLVRLLTALEMAEHQTFYDINHKDYVDLVDDTAVVCDLYNNLLRSVCKDGGWAEMLHMFGASAALSMPLQSYCPPVLNEHYMARPLTRTICGRGVRSSTLPPVTLMWSMSSIPKTQGEYVPNHFVVLQKTTATTTTLVDLTQDCDHSSIDDALLQEEINSTPVSPQTPSQHSFSSYTPTLSSPEQQSTTSSPQQFTTSLPEQSSSSPEQTSSSNDISDISINPDQRVVVSSGCDLPTGPNRKHKFLDIDDLVAALSGAEDAIDMIPRGIKENTYFIVDNSSNIERRQKGLKSQFWDDCGAWVSGAPNNKSIFVCTPGMKLRKVVLRNGQYCFERQRQKKTIFIPLEPQPDPAALLTIHRYYTKHTNSNYERRISWLETEDTETPRHACYEYKGEFPESSEDQYVRLRPEVMERMKADLKSAKPAKVFLEADIIDGPIKMKQVHNAKYRDKKKTQPQGTQRGNLADHVQHVENLAHTHPFIQQVSHSKEKVPKVILYTQEQIEDIKRSCCPDSNGLASVMGFDKTFNLGELHVTVGVFKNLSVTRRHTGEHPIIAGPMFLHGNSDFKSYASFFQLLAAELADAPSQPVTGSDDERAMRKAMNLAFPNAPKLSCTRHLKGNVVDYLRDKVGLPTDKRNEVISAVFGSGGLVEADEEIVFNIKLQDCLQLMDSTCPQFKEYFRSRVAPLLEENMKTSQQDNLIGVSGRWTNNNCESINHVLKQAVNWKSQPLTDLIEKLYEVVRKQYKDLERALLGQGDFVLCDEYQRFSVAPNVWCSRDQQQRQRHFLRFLRKVKEVHKKNIRSTDGSRVVTSATNAGKKPGQVKRKRTAKTTTVTYKKQKL